MNRLYCMPCGDSMLDEFAFECRARKYNYDDAIFVSASGADVVLPAQALSFDALAKYILRLFGKEAESISIFSQKLLLGGLLKEMKNKGQLKFFAGLDESDAFNEAVFSFISELGDAMITPEDFNGALRCLSDGGGVSGKDRELATIYLAYRQLLTASGLHDTADIYLAAIAVLKEHDLSKYCKKAYISGFHRLSVLQLELVRQLSRCCEVDIGLCWQNEAVYGAAQKMYQDIAGLGFEIVHRKCEKSKAETLQQLCDDFFRLETQREIAVSEAVSVKLCANRRQEMQAVVSEIKSQLREGVKTEEILLCMRNLSLYPGLKREFDLAGVPVDMPDAVRLTVQPAARLIDSVLQIAAGDVRQGLSRFFGNFFVQEIMGVDNAKILKFLAESFFSDLPEAVSLLEREFWDEAKFKIFLGKQYAFWRKIPAQASMEVFNDALLDFLQSLAAAQTLGGAYKAEAIDGGELQLLATGYERTVSTLQTLGRDFAAAGEADRVISVWEYRQILTKLFAEHSFLLQKNNAAGICVTSIEKLPEKNFRHVYIMGLKEGELPFFAQENWLYDDSERQKLYQIGLLTSTNDKAADELFFFYKALCLAEEKLYLSASLADNEIISAYLDEVLRLISATKVEVRAANQLLPGYGEIADKGRLACRLLEDRQRHEWLNTYLGEDFFARLDTELPSRQGLYAGKLTGGSAALQISELLGLCLDASRLESYALCPFKFLLEYVWRPVDWSVAQEEMRADVKGNIYHECLKRFLQKYSGRTLTGYDRQNLVKEMEEIFDAVTLSLLEKGRLVTTYLSNHEFDEMKEKLVLWLGAELRYQSESKGRMYPDKFEWGFEDFALGGQFRFKGRIDRIDTDGEHCFVTDYKLKTTPGKLDIEKGLDLQMPLYLLAVEHFLGQPLGGGYFSVEKAERGGGFWLNNAKDKVSFAGQIKAQQKDLGCDDWAVYREKFTQTIKILAAAIDSGDFAPAPKEECPSYCLGQGICRIAQSTEQG